MKVPTIVEIPVFISDLFRERRMYSLINLNGSALCFRKMIVSIPVTFSPKFLDFIFVFELF
ncbi:MAG: hypothetical protein Ct9H300mP21_05970 [Pseudomonadota bacterium]|nr:MAG: hypothetical protein Ct9H300mP21_05970 [Pseudomonadota bacterium]